MPTFTIYTDNNITAHAQPPTTTDGCHAFTTEKEFAKLSAAWAASRLVEIWNSFAGVAPFDDLRPVKKFTDRASAIVRIWKAVQRMNACLAPQAARVAPKATRATKKASAAKEPTRAEKGASVAREGSKKAVVLDLLRRKQGATLAQIMKATGWQAHSVRGFISGAITKKMGLNVESFRNDAEERAYKITK
jgi:hypothetical protein